MDWSVFYLILDWGIRLVMLFAVSRRHAPGYAMAWLVVIFFFPEIGLFVYLLLGENRLPRRRIEQHRELAREMRQITQRFKDHPKMFIPRLNPVQSATVKLARRLGQMPIVGGNRIEFINDTDEVVRRLIQDIDGAEHQVHLLFYIFAADATGGKVVEALKRAARRGVTCRLMVDAVGSSRLVKRFSPDLRKAGIEFSVALPVNLLRRKLARIDLRNHRKLAVIDGRIGYTGSQNIVDADYGRKHLAWQDIMARVQGPVVAQFQVIFLQDWYFETKKLLTAPSLFPEQKPSGDIAAQTVPSGPNFPSENYQRLVVAALHDAQEKVVITTPYFVPDEAFLQAIQVAVFSGVEVLVIAPQKSDQLIVGTATMAYFENLLDIGAKVYMHERGLLHAKTLTVDDSFAFVGTGNFDIRSFTLNFEVNLVLYGKEVTRSLRAHQEHYLKSAHRLTRQEIAKRSRAYHQFKHVVKLLSPFL